MAASPSVTRLTIEPPFFFTTPSVTADSGLLHLSESRAIVVRFFATSSTRAISERRIIPVVPVFAIIRSRSEATV